MMLSRFICFFLTVPLAYCTYPSGEQAQHEPADGLCIQVWYGTEQHFGQRGTPQRWINIPGNVKAAEGLRSLHYTLNGSDPVALSAGEDGRRLARAGDFNIDIDTALLIAGKNNLLISAADSQDNKITKEVTVYYKPGKTWPLPYSIDWKHVKKITDAVQVVDGRWQLTENGVRTRDPYYDRVLAFGDHTWKDYEITAAVIFHDFTPPQKGPPTFNVSHAAIATRWPGHDTDDQQPHVKWYPLGATAEFRLTARLDSCRWRIFDGENLYAEDTTKIRTVALDTWYGMKHRVETQPDGSTLYSVKCWEDGQPEPADWDLQALEPPGNLSSGSALLIAHNTDVTFGNIQAVPLP